MVDICSHQWSEMQDMLFRGGMYEKVKPIYQIGIVDFTLFTETPAFYTNYQLRDEKNKHIYTDIFNIGVLDLTKIKLATDEDKKYNIDKWAALFKAKTWEDIKMIATKDKAIGEAAYTIYKISEDEKIRQECAGFQRVHICLDSSFVNERHKITSVSTGIISYNPIIRLL